MPSEFGPEQSTGLPRVVIAPVLEFQFGLYLLRQHCIDPGKWVPSWVAETAQAAPEVVARWQAFWVGPDLDQVNGDDYRDCGELLVAGWSTGTLFAPTIKPFLEALEPALAGTVRVPTLESEPPAVVDLIRRRLAFLAGDAAARAEYVSLIRELFGLMGGHWEQDGRMAAERAAGELTARVRAGVADLRTLIPGNKFLHKDAYQPQILSALEKGELTIVPLGLGGGGQFYWSFDGAVVIGAGIQSAERDARRKERAERAANRLKVLSDPTRLAILIELLRVGQQPSGTVSELARQFGLSQPTVSVHMKLLREAGLVRPERDGNQVFYRAEEAVVRRYMEQATGDILQQAESLPASP